MIDPTVHDSNWFLRNKMMFGSLKWLSNFLIASYVVMILVILLVMGTYKIGSGSVAGGFGVVALVTALICLYYWSMLPI